MSYESMIYLIPIFAVTAFVYASVGLGGASMYLAVLALFHVPYQDIPPAALACNIIVTAGVTCHFWRAGHVKPRLILPFIVTSVPMTFVGAGIKLSEPVFYRILAVVLIIAAVRTFFFKEGAHVRHAAGTRTAFIYAPLAGAALGALAGMIGIGGGLFLLPVILLLGWGDAKESAAAAGAFTLVNSAAGLVAHGAAGRFDWAFILPLACAVFVGGQLGAHCGARRFSPNAVRKIFAVILFGVAVRLLAAHF
jgi:uncharacterized membrane protein YfcA